MSVSQRIATPLFLVLLAVVATQAQPISQGDCHKLVAKGPSGYSRTVNLDVLSSMPNDFTVAYSRFAGTLEYRFRVCSNLVCGSYKSATCEKDYNDNIVPLGRGYDIKPGAYLNMDYLYGAIQFNTTAACDGRTCRASTITVVCDPNAPQYVLWISKNLVFFHLLDRPNSNGSLLFALTSQFY
jgi:hypothetical protein